MTAVKLNFTTEYAEKSNCSEISRHSPLYFVGGIMIADNATGDFSTQAVEL